MSKKQTHTKSLWQSIIIASLSIIFFTVASPIFAQTTAQLILDVNIVNPVSGPVETGQVIEYVIDFSCASVTGPCGALDIDFPLDTELELIEVIAPPGYIGSFSGTPPNIIVNIINDPVSNNTFDDGEAAQVTVRTRVTQDIVDSTIETNVTGEITNSDGTATASTSTPDMSVNPPEGGWGVTKATVAPSGGLGPAANGEATYNIEVCPTETEGVAQITQLVFNDRFPIGATIQSSNPGTFVLEDQLPLGTPDGTDDTIVWTIDFAPPHTVDDGCVDVTYTLAFPNPPFTAGSDITNEAFVSATTDPNSTPFPNDGDCPNCVGRGTNPGTIDNPSVTGNASKSGPGTTIVSPGVSGGTSTFNIAWDLAQANVSGTGFTITDTFPVANSDGLPITEISEITTATWDDGHQALLQIMTVGTPAWTTIDTVDGSTASTYFAGGALPAIPPPAVSTDNLITGLRWQFINDVPPGFATNNAAVVRFFVRDGMDPVLDYGSPTFLDYSNCIDLSGTYTDENGVPQPIPPSQDCANLRISDDDTDGITNIQTSKSRDKSSVFPLEDIQFTLTLELTQEASGDLLNPAIQDILPFGMQITSWDEVEFINTAGASEEILPYLRVDDVTVAGERRQRLLFYWDDTVTGSDSDTLVTQPFYAPSYTPTSYTCTNPTNCQDPIADPTFANNYDYSLLAGTAPAVGNSLAITPPATGVKTINIRFTAQPRLDSVAGDDDGNLIPSTNSTTVVTDSAVVTCQTGTQSTESGDDIDDDGDTTETICTTSTSFQIREAAQMASQKWIRDTAIIPNLGFVNSQDLNDSSPACPTFTYNPISEGANVDYTRFPCVAQGASGGSFEYLMRIQNTGLVNTEDYILYDVLPHIGDTGVSEALASDPRLTEFHAYLTGPIVEEDIPAGFTYVIEYNTDPSYNSCRPEMSSDSTESPANHWQGTCDNSWRDEATLLGDGDTFLDVTSFRIRQTGGVIPSGDELIFTAPMVIDATPGEAETGEIAWNTFAQRFDNQPSGRRLLTAEPRKVGIIVEEVFSIGNRVWIDDGIGGGIADNGRIDGTEIGVNGVTVELYLTSDLTTPYATDVTRRNLGPNGVDDGGAGDDGEDGYYFFGNLPAGQYRVVVVGNEFDTGQELNGYISSTGSQSANANNNNDSRDTGQDQTTPATYISNGVRTNNFNLVRNTEATGETDVNDDNAGTDPSPPTNEGLFGRGENYEQDVDSDLTIDFGFFRPMSIGNLVWLDNGADSTAPNGFNAAQFNDGIFNGNEVGIENVTVLLYYDSNRDGVVNGSDTPQSTTTDAQGYYLFDGLAPGEYRVEIPAAEFAGGGDLEGLGSSFDAVAPADADPDNDDHGIDVALPVVAPVTSPTIILSPLGEPTIEDDEAVTGLGANGEIDENSDLTVDFGFVELMSIGNRVWYDMGVDTSTASGFVPGQLNDGIINGTELGVPNVTVELYLASNLVTPISSTMTDGTGYYLFDNLLRGDYIVSIPVVNFGSGQPLEGYLSSTDNTAPADGDPDNDDHGIDVTPTVISPINSPTITLTPAGETQADDEAVTGTTINPPPTIADNNSDLTVDFGFYKSMSIGNRIWLDNGDSGGSTVSSQVNDGTLNGTEAGIDGVTVNLYLATDLTTPISTTTTINGGYYLFDGLGPNDYVVEVPASNFTGALLGLQSSFDASAPADADPDNDDHGIDVAVPVTDPVRSPTITLTLDSETQIDDEAVTGTGSNFETDDNSDLTVDFGFVEVMSIGNRVWYDMGEDSSAGSGFVPSQLNDGLLNGTEVGVAGVTVNLYLTSDLTTPISTTVTNGTGHYLFDNLLRGDYVVTIPVSNFGTGQPLEGYFSSADTAAPVDADPDNDDHGIDVTPTIISAISSPVISLSPSLEPVAGDDEAVTGTANNPPPNIADYNSDLTVDFGFYKSMSLGNRVWFDSGISGTSTIISQYNDGILNGTEAGIDGVTVNLYFANDLTTPISTTTTTSGGYYLFDGLVPNTYVVEIPLSNFSGPLLNLQSSFDASTPVDADPDNDDHGIDVAIPVTNPVRSPSITLTLDGETQIDDEAVTGTGSNFESDDNSDLTVDFGFIGVMSLGNRVWLDDGAVSGGFDQTQFDNGIVDGTEAGIPDVAVNLYFASDLTTAISSTTTDGTGYYLFDNLPPGDYVVELPASNFTTGNPLEGHLSSTDIVAPVDADADNDDHGIDPTTPGTDPILSPIITLTLSGEAQVDDEAVTGTDGGTAPFITDDNSDLTVDFGLFRPMSIGNRVWLDIERAIGTLGDGVRQGSETSLGLGGVTVQLYTVSGTSSLGTLIAETTTTGVGTDTNNGYYMFDRQGNDQTAVGAPRLGPGNYIVHIPASQFAPAGVLNGFVNSNGPSASGGDTQTDSSVGAGDENGIDAIPGTTSTYPVNAGVSSTVINLAYDAEPVIGNEPDRDPNRITDINGLNVEDDNSDLTIDFAFYQGLAIGNRVWFDGNRDGFIDANDRSTTPGNPGIAGVTVYLYRDTDGNGVPDGAFIASDTTDSEGYYIFDQLTSGGLLVPDNYIVGIDPSETANLTALADHVSTITRVSGTTPLGTPLDSPTDNDDNGIDRRDIDPDPTIIYSESIALSHFDETIAEADADKETGVGDGNGIQDINSNLTVDFGFFVPMSIGNQVWFDENNNALIDPTEDGINGVTVELFRDTGSGIDPLNDTPYRVTTTVSGTPNGNGYYIFDDLPEGDYVVRLAPVNFNTGGALIDAAGAPYSSSESGGATEATYLLDNQTDNNDNGIDENFPQTNGIISNVINLSYNAEPDTTADDVGDLNPAVGEGTFGERDNNADMTIDFGVYPPLMSIGNRIFKDYDNNRILDGADVGVDGVVVNLFRDNDQNGIPDSGINSPIATTTTANDGYYIFDGLMDGFYLVQVDENNFRSIAAGGNGILLDYYSSQDKDASNTNVVPVDGDQLDSIDTGVDNPFILSTNNDLAANGIFSPTIQLIPSNEWDLEPDRGPEGDGEPNIQASNSDLTVDFGFYQPMSLGNFVWFDTDENSLYNGAESFIAGVQVELYRETDGTPAALNTATDTLVQLYDGTSFVNFDTTDSNGFYLFDNLPAGQYWVHIPATEFASGRPLFNHVSTTPENTPSSVVPSSDSNDNGIVTGTEVVDGVTSELITLGVIDPVNGSGLYIPNGSEPINEVHKSNNPPTPSNTYDGPASIGRYGELDNNSDITIDFGFTLADEASMSIGNRVWFDTNHNGIIDNAGDDNPVATGNPGIDGVTVLLYRADVSGNPIGDPIARDITANGGYYLFDVLDTDTLIAVGDGDGLGGPVTPGNYVVALPSSNFIGGGPLENHASTTYNVDNDGTFGAPSTGTEGGYGPLADDNNHNGTADATYGILSDLVTLTLQSERDDEDDKDTSNPPDIGDGLDSTNTPITTNNSDLTIDFGFYLPMSLGNFVWVDTNNDGLYDDTTEVPVDDGVIMALYAADGTTPIDDPANPGTPYQVTTVDGFYLFEGLPSGQYVVRVDLLNFLPGGLLEGYTGSDNSGAGFQDNTDDDLNDNGFDADPTTNGGIPSGVITLEYTTEPLLEATSGNPADGPNGRGNNGELDANSNLTVDFGVYTSTYFSIGNRVWVDMGAGANENNGLHDTDELGIQDVIVNLFRDENDGAGGGPDGIPDSTTPFATTLTDVDGYYLFDSLANGNYIVSVSPDNFDAGGALRGYSPSPVVDATESITDHASDQISNTIDPDFGFYSATYILELTPSEPEFEDDATPAGATQDPGVDPFGNPIPDDQSNLTVDFGFIRTLTLGNLVWFDIDNDGQFDDGVEVGIAGVTVELYLNDGTTPGTFDGTNTLVDTEITDGNGFYLFEDLDPNDYFLHIPNDPNWATGTGPLEGFQSSGPDATSPDTGDDNDNGIGTADTNPTPGVTSELLTLNFGTAPTGESTLSNNPADGPEFRGVNNPPDNNSDLTWDFGFFLGEPMSIGNIVWIDDGNTTGTASNGIRDGDELGVDGVIVELYADSNGDGNPDTTTPIQTTTTASGGYYLFDGLPPGQYVVVIAEENFDSSGVLNGYLSTNDNSPTSPVIPDRDNEDNGIDNPTPSTGGVQSGTIILEVGLEPTDPTPADPTNGDDEDSEDVTGTGSNGETDPNSNLTVDFGFIAAYDWGDAPDSYGTDNDILTTVSPTGFSDQIGPSHRIVANLYLGAFVDDETNGVPVPDGTSNNTNDPDGDGADGGFDEDGMDVPDFVAGTTVTVDVTAFNETGEDATLIAWFDWNGDGVFDASEAYTVSVPDGTDGIVQLDVDVPADAEDLTGGATYARLRLTTDTITTSDFIGPMDSGEVEDYYVTVFDPGLLINKTDGLNSIVAGEVNTYTIVIENSGDPRTGVRFRDDIQLATATDANGYDPETIEWTCVAENDASCIAGAVSGTGSSGGPYAATATSVVINELIDLPRNGRVTYTITARVNEDAGLIPPGNTTPLTNVAQLPNELPPIEDEDVTSIIFDPPFGVKTGTFLGNNIIRWTMTWYNPGATQTNVTITDELASNQTFPPTAGEIDLQCSGSTGTCSIVGDDVVLWQGTMLTSTPDDDDDAVVIAFNVLIRGDGRYNNTATLDYGDEQTSASARVTIEDDEETEDDEAIDDGGFTQSAPRLAKSVDTPFTLPGATVVWTIEAINDTDQTVTNVSITDEVPASLTITDGTSSSGELTIDGQTVTVKQDSFAPGEIITITLTTEISPEVAVPFAINNPAVLRCDCANESNAIATIISVLELPATGETPWWRLPLMLLILTGGIGTSLLIGYRRKTKHIS